MRHFIWGCGGVGKSHVALKVAHEMSQSDSASLITLDPSLRLLELMQTVPEDLRRFDIIPLKPELLFEEFHRRAPAQPHLKQFYLQMVKSLQQFREYLQLIQLCRFLEQSTAGHVIIDTPPFQESGGLLKSMESLHAFFHQTIVQWALKTSSNSLLQFGTKKLFELTRLFVGKRASQSVFDLLSWLTHHSDSFKTATNHLQDLLSSPRTIHHLVVTPETPFEFIRVAMKHFHGKANVTLILNRSCEGYPFPDHSDSFSLEMNKQICFERTLKQMAEENFSHLKMRSISIQLMGDDTQEEMSLFLRNQ